MRITITSTDVRMTPAGIGQAAANAYREMRRAQHRARLDEQATVFEPDFMAAEREAIRAVWRAVFGATV
jgi:glutamate-ammonia-ligase adenylyltransferase